MMQIEMVDIDALVFDPNNARKHDDKNLQAIRGSLRKFGQQKPIVVNAKNVVIAGNGTVAGAKAEGWKKVAVVRSALDDFLQSAYALADNRSSELAEWDEEILKASLAELEIKGFDIGDIGFDPADFDFLDEPKDGLTNEDAVPEVAQNVHGVTLGDIWQLGNHRIMCGDSTDKATVEKLMSGERADMVFTDPPYGMSVVKRDGQNNGLGESIDGVVGVVGVAARGKYKPVIGDDTTKTAIDSYHLCVDLKVPTMIFWGANFYAESLQPSSGWIVWDKENGEGFFADGELAWSNSDKQLRIYKHQWKGMIRQSERGEKRVHPTQKPIALAEWCFENYGKPKSVLDIFLGSGSTLIACEKTNRKCYGMELDPHYCSVIIQRWQDFTGLKAERVTDG